MTSEIKTILEFYQVLADPKEHYVEFAVYEDEWEVNGSPTDPLFKGSIKWDGCSNWEFGQMHFCRKTEAVNFGVLLGKLYEWAAELMPDNKEYLGDDK